MPKPKLQWYLTRYAHLNGGFELISYTLMPSLAVAQYKAQTRLPNNEFYEVECRVGSLLPPTPPPCWIAREVYSHKPHIAELQADAEVRAYQIFGLLETDFDLKEVLSEMQLLKPLLTKPQYKVLLDALMTKPCVIKILYEENN